MNCRVCGDENAIYQAGARQTLCADCNDDTPRKVGRSAFDKAYWGAKSGDPPVSIRREFYSDYLTSTHTVREYIRATTEKEN